MKTYNLFANLLWLVPDQDRYFNWFINKSTNRYNGVDYTLHQIFGPLYYKTMDVE